MKTYALALLVVLAVVAAALHTGNVRTLALVGVAGWAVALLASTWGYLRNIRF